ncbi:uncharacterized protein LOC129984758 [Argiope bruennichi]|uniref:uncharacterized protein LOC129984758 n=1 Tax=Argiope bruennichi TaxID=94029 RepID=UPI0024956B78|nr:uncharacterized protein LOC129984758 [Argiope bruennichi]
MEETRPAPELLLAQLVLSAVLLFLVGHATYEGEYPIPEFKYEVHWGRPVFLEEGQRRGVEIREFRAAYTVLLLMAVSSAYFFTNLLLYATLKLMRDPMPLYKKTTLILTQDVIFCFLMFVCSIGAVSYPGERAVKNRETEILIASGISIFCCVSSGVGVYYSYKLYKGL